MSTARSVTLTASAPANVLRWINHGMESLWLLTVFVVPLAFFSRDAVLSEAVISYAEVPKLALLRVTVGLMVILWLMEWGFKQWFPQSFPQSSPSELRSGGRAFQISAWPIQLAQWLRSQPTRWASQLSTWLTRLTGWLRRQPTNWLVLSVWFYLGVTLLTTVLSTSFNVSLWGEIPGQDGFAAYTVICYVLMFGVITTHLKTQGQLWRLLGAIVAMGIIVSGYAVLQHHGHDFLGLLEPPGGERATSTVANAVFAGALMLMPISISLMLATIVLRGQPTATGRFGEKVRQRALVLALMGFWVLALAVQFLGIIFTFSRGPWSGALLALTAFLALAGAFAGWRALSVAVLVLGLAATLTLAFIQWPGSQLPGAVSVISLALVGAVFLAGLFIDLRRLGKLALALAAIGVLGGAIALVPLLLRDSVPPLAEEASPAVSQAVPSDLSQVTSRFTSIGGQVTSGALSNRGVIWRGSWRLIKDRPWFDFEDLSLSWLRPVIGYGPDLFRYAYLLESPPEESSSTVPREPDHAHNYFIHQGVEQGFLGILSSLGVFVAVFVVGGYQLIVGRRICSDIHKLALAGLLATLAGRLLEQLTGVARVSDLIVFWALLAGFAILPAVMQPPQEPPVAAPERRPQRNRRRNRGQNRRQTPGSPAPQIITLTRLAAVSVVIAGIATVTWVKGVNPALAAVSAGDGVERFQRGDLQGSLASLERAAALAPDVPLYYNYISTVYTSYIAYRDDNLITPEPECSLKPKGVPYDACLAQRAYFNDRIAFEQRPLYFRSRLALADSAFVLKLDDEAVRLYEEVVALVPGSWPLKDLLAEAYVQSGQPEKALEIIEESLAFTEGRPSSAGALYQQGLAYRDLGRLEEAAESLQTSVRIAPESIAFMQSATQALADVQAQLEARDQSPQHRSEQP